MAQQVVNPEKLAEAQEAAGAAMEAADAALEAAALAAQKVAELAESSAPTNGGQGDIVQHAAPHEHAGSDGSGGRPVAAEALDEMADGYRIIQYGPQDFSVEGVFRQDGAQRFKAANGFPSEAAARQWINDRLAAG